MQVMQGFRNGSVHALIATDAPRGIDVDDIDVVINYDLPQSFEYYVPASDAGRADKRRLANADLQRQAAGDASRAYEVHGHCHRRAPPTDSEIMDKAVARTAFEIESHARRTARKPPESSLRTFSRTRCSKAREAGRRMLCRNAHRRR